jgi:hypothetical protein
LRIGAEGRWNLPRGFSLFGRAAGSVLVGNVRVQQQEIDEIEGTILDFSDSYHQAIPVIETGGRGGLDSWHVGCGLGVPLSDGGDDLAHEFVDLLRSSADELRRVHRGGEVESGEGWVALQPLDQIVGPAFVLDHRGGGLTVLANPLVQHLAVPPAATAAIRMFSLAMNGSSSRRFLAITFG